MNTISVKEFIDMPEDQRSGLIYEVLSALQKGVSDLTDDMKYVKKCAEDGRLTDKDNDMAIQKAQSEADRSVDLAILANKRIDKMIWAVAATLIGTILTVGTAIVIFLIQQGLKI